MSNINEIADGYVERAAPLNPLEATYCGIPGYDDRMSDLSPEGFRARVDLDRETIAALNAATANNESEQVAKDAMLERLGLAVEFYDAGEATSDLNVIASPLQAVRQVFDLMPVEGEEAQRNLALRMAAVPAAYAGLRRTLLESAKNGHVAARRQVIECAKQCAEWSGRPSSAAESGYGTGAESAGFYAGLVGRTGAEGALRAELDRAAQKAQAATAEFGAFLDPSCCRWPRADAVGRERYALDSRYFLGAAIDLDETYAWGWSEVKRFEAEMHRVAGLIVPGGTVDDAVTALDPIPAADRRHGRPSATGCRNSPIATIAELARHALRHPRARPADRVHDRADQRRRRSTTPRPSEDFTRPGRMWWAVPDGVEEFSTWREVTTVLPRGRPRSPPAGRAGRLPARNSSTAGSG